MRLAAIAAVAENYIIGRDNDLPWRLPADLRWFVKHTKGKPIISGRKTFESTGYLKGRRNIVVTRNHDWSADCDAIAHSLDDAIALAGDADEVMLLGGAGIYREAMSHIQRLYLTVVHAEPTGDTKFPPLDDQQWHVVGSTFHPADAENVFEMTFLVLDRRERGPVKPSELIPAAWRRPQTSSK